MAGPVARRQGAHSEGLSPVRAQEGRLAYPGSAKEEDMPTTRVDDLAEKLSGRGGPLDYGPELSRLTIRVVRAVAAGTPVTREQVGRLAADLAVSPHEAERFLGQVAEYDPGGNIVGIAGLSLNEHPHRLSVDGRGMSTWCALDTLFLPALLGRAAAVESYSPVTREPIRLRVSPERVEQASPAGAVLSMVTVGQDRRAMTSVQALWSAFCCHVHFFASREEAERWAADRDDIAVLSIEEGFELGRRLWAKALSTMQ
jgi:alkylmercury lyase